jgi:hypothetical protein
MTFIFFIIIGTSNENSLFKIFDYSIQSLVVECACREEHNEWLWALVLAQFSKVDKIIWKSDWIILVVWKAVQSILKNKVESEFSLV